MFFSNRRRDMLALIGAIIVIAWLLGLTAFHVTGGLIHLALVVGLVLVVLHFLTGRRGVASRSNATPSAGVGG
jgi:hypothetical protein